jgi:hypothetical protein
VLSISGTSDTPASPRIEVPPPWLMHPASAVLEDLQAAETITGLQIVARPIPELNGLTLGVVEASAVTGELVELPDDLEPDEPTQYRGGNWVPRSLTGPDLLVLIADILQEDLAESEAAWGQSRPPCPHHPHPARPVLHDNEAWWTCSQDRTALYRIGRGEVPRGVLPSPTWRKESQRARKRRHR